MFADPGPVFVNLIMPWDFSKRDRVSDQNRRNAREIPPHARRYIGPCEQTHAFQRRKQVAMPAPNRRDRGRVLVFIEKCENLLQSS